MGWMGGRERERALCRRKEKKKKGKKEKKEKKIRGEVCLLCIYMYVHMGRGGEEEKK